MKTKKGPVIVHSYHYDAVDPDSEIKQDLRINLEHPEIKDENDQPADESAGVIFQLVVPFEIHPQGAPFQVSGTFSQIMQLEGFHGQPEDLDNKDVQQISRELVEYVETITYQVTAITLNHGISLNFSPADDSVEPNETVKKLREKKNKKD